MQVTAFAFAIILASMHIFAKNLRFIRIIPRSRFLSLGGGVSVGYVFIHILPELTEHQSVIEHKRFLLSYLEHHVYLLAMLGLVIFYILESIAKKSQRKNQQDTGKKQPKKKTFWIHISSFAIYNGLIGYLLIHRDSEGLLNLILYVIAMALHFIVVDYGLRTHHKDIYNRIGRWLLALAVMIGWGIGVITEIPESALALLFAFLSGAIILNVLKEELPEDRESSTWAFSLGAIGYVVLLLTIA
ncbi:hypothetical protein GCM10011351_09820 [Paraliobacillus quinghaiensis]|uniref:ZIP Zinc transporter n=1 Tax=Paraliobacillus quinghaiensis TaxID=470815 RepID=A0A917WSY9_9BACI|nr:hypothetical protein [Paraliobacillus quinghaiensis]GGM26221.1 hypothetical protein GCM10011351_09820 [Paraliobacillus quinghaiensis]